MRGEKVESWERMRLAPGRNKDSGGKNVGSPPLLRPASDGVANLAPGRRPTAGVGSCRRIAERGGRPPCNYIALCRFQEDYWAERIAYLIRRSRGPMKKDERGDWNPKKEKEESKIGARVQVGLLPSVPERCFLGGENLTFCNCRKAFAYDEDTMLYT